MSLKQVSQTQIVRGPKKSLKFPWPTSIKELISNKKLLPTSEITRIIIDTFVSGAKGQVGKIPTAPKIMRYPKALSLIFPVRTLFA